MQNKKDVRKDNNQSMSYQRTRMQKDLVLQRLKEEGYKITKQREILLDIILQKECASCKEIYYKAISIDSGVGMATVYRMVNLLEEIGAISRKNMYKISCCMECARENACVVEFEDNTTCHLSAKKWHEVILEGLKACGYVEEQKVKSVLVEPCTDECC